MLSLKSPDITNKEIFHVDEPLSFFIISEFMKDPKIYSRKLIKKIGFQIF